MRRNIEEFELDIPETLNTALQVRGTWMHVYDRVEGEVAACQIFGEFRVIETELAEYLGVSRTVARDVLSRLNERGLVRKGAQSPWLAGPLTAKVIREKFQLRGIVEPAALRLAADHIDPDQIMMIRKHIDSGEKLHWEMLENALMQHCLERAPNGALVDMIRNNRLLLSSVDHALNGLGLPLMTWHWQTTGRCLNLSACGRSMRRRSTLRSTCGLSRSKVLRGSRSLPWFQRGIRCLVILFRSNK